MKYWITRDLYGYWNKLRAGRTAPERYEADPSDIRHILANTFILQRSEDSLEGACTIRLAGTRLCGLFCSDLKGRSFPSLWSRQDQPTLRELTAGVCSSGAVAVVYSDALNARGCLVEMEIILLPLKHDGAGFSRIIGTMAPAEDAWWMGLHPIIDLRVKSLRIIGPDSDLPDLTEPFVTDVDRVVQAGSGEFFTDTLDPEGRQVRRIAHLMVYEGGRA